ncbi:MAG: flippase-like domain-containing protein [Oligoflexales bacterium]|nr:flippase-like domain-containing protein [Oligoflexales bacterium]
MENKEKSYRFFFILILKFSVVLAALSWLVRSEKIDFSTVPTLFQDPYIILGHLGVWLFGVVLMTSLRWFFLLKAMGLHLTLRKTISFNLIGYFFNMFAPGAVGGDLVKAIYVYREQVIQEKTRALLSIILDRVLGLYSIFMLASVGILLNVNYAFSRPSLGLISLFVLSCWASLTAFFLSVMMSSRISNDPFSKLFSKNIPGFKLLNRVYSALLSIRSKPLHFLAAALFSCLFQMTYMSFFFFITCKLSSSPFKWAEFLVVFPIGALSTALPIAPGGFGVGHLAFERTFSLIGVKEGAYVFNVVFLGQAVLSLLGMIPYFLHRSPGRKLDEERSRVLQGLDG